MRNSHNKKSKRLFIAFRNRIRRTLEYTKKDFARSNDPELNKIGPIMNIVIIRWTPHTYEALTCIYNKEIFPDGISMKKLGNYFSNEDYIIKWINYRYRPGWELWEIVNDFVMANRTRYRK